MKYSSFHSTSSSPGWLSLNSSSYSLETMKRNWLWIELFPDAKMALFSRFGARL